MWTDGVPAGTGMTAWSTFRANTPNFGLGPQTAMVNYHLAEFDALLAELAKASVSIDPTRETAIRTVCLDRRP